MIESERQAELQCLQQLRGVAAAVSPALDHRLDSSQALEQLKENAWAARQDSFYQRGRPRPGPERRSG